MKRICDSSKQDRACSSLSLRKSFLLFFCLLLYIIGLCGCSKDEILEEYNEVIQFAGNFRLTSDFLLKGRRKCGVDRYTGEYTADYDNFSKTEYLFGGTTIDREYGKEVSVFCRIEGESGSAELFWESGSEETTVLLDADGTYRETLTLPEGGNYIGIAGEHFTGEVELRIE